MPFLNRLVQQLNEFQTSLIFTFKEFRIPEPWSYIRLSVTGAELIFLALFCLNIYDSSSVLRDIAIGQELPQLIMKIV